MTVNRMSRLFSLVLAAAGLALTLFLTWAHLTDSLGMICTEGGGCGTVLTSAYSVFLGLPTAFYGFVYYLTVVFLVIVFPYFRSESQHGLLTTILAINSGGLVISLLLTGYSAFGLNQFCGYCLTSTGLVTGLFGVSLFWTIRRTRMKTPDRPWAAFWKSSTAITLVLLVIVGGFYYQSTTIPVSAENSSREFTALASEPTAIGDPDAPIRVVEFFDLGCPHCQRFTLNTFPEIRKNYIETGKVVWIFRDFPIPRAHPHALYAHSVLSRIPSDQFLDAKKRIMREADQWNARNNASPESYFNFFRKRYGLSADGAPPEALSRQIIQRRDTMSRLGIKATPSFLVNGKVYRGGRGYDAWSKIFDAILRQSETP